MYSYAFDKGISLMVGVLSTKPYWNEDEDYAILLDSVTRTQNTGRPGDPFKFILVIDANVPIPNATWRRRFAKSRTRSFFPFLFATVTPSHLLRGVMTMINWVTPPPGGSATNSVATFDEAVAWLEERTGRKIPLARKLFEEAKVPIPR
jgi:hypothetical protein